MTEAIHRPLASCPGFEGSRCTVGSSDGVDPERVLKSVQADDFGVQVPGFARRENPVGRYGAPVHAWPGRGRFRLTRPSAAGGKEQTGRPGARSASVPSIPVQGRMTVSMTWITPFDVSMSVWTTLALSILTPPATTWISTSDPWTVAAESRPMTSAAMTLPGTT